MFKSTFAVTLDYPDTMSLADAVSVAHSQVTNFSAGFMANFEWLFLPHYSDLDDEAWKEKENEILDCLQGTNDVVDLWKLRELALSKGGLLTPNLRKRAWLKLTACHDQVFSPKPYQPLVDPSRFDMEGLRRDVAKTIWNVEEHVVASKKEQKEQDEKLQQFLEIQKQRGQKRVSWAPMAQMVSPGLGNNSDPPKSIATSPSTDDEDEKNDDSSNLSCEGMEAFSPGHSALTQETNFTLSSRVVRWRKASRQEQKILFNVITAVLRTEAAPSSHFEDDRYHYFPGLQDITALLIINLESPSLTSMVLNRLAEGHLRDSMRSDRLIAETAIAHMFMPLLESVDRGLYDHLSAAGIILPTFARRWITCWFSQDVPNVQIASRIMDVLVASHPLMPMYMAVAILTVNRSQIFNAQHQLSVLYSTMRNLPMQNLASADGDSLMHAEEVIETAMSYMKRFPPGSLLVAANNRMGPNADNVKVYALLPAIAMFQDPPAWTTAAEAPSDWALLQRAKALRLQEAQGEVGMREPGSKLEAENMPGLTEYPLAVAAAGLAPSSHHRRSSLQFGFVALLAVGFLFLSTTTTTSFSNVAARVFRPVKEEPSGPQLFLPRAKRQTKNKLGLASIFAPLCSALTDNDKCSAPASRRPVTTNNTADTDTKPSTNVPSIVGVSFMEDLDFTSPFLDNYYSLGSYFADKSQHVWSALCRQLVKLRVLWDDNSHVLGSFVAVVPSIVKATFTENLEFTSTTLPDTDIYYALGSYFADKPQHVWSFLNRQLVKVRVVWDDHSYALGSFVADKPQHVRSLLHRQVAKLRGLLHGVLVVPLPCVS